MEEGVVLTLEKIRVTLRQELGFETDFVGEGTWVKTDGWAGLVAATAKLGYEDEWLQVVLK